MRLWGKETKSAWLELKAKGQSGGQNPPRTALSNCSGVLQAPESWRPSGSQWPCAVKPHVHNPAALSAGMPRGAFSFAIKFASGHPGHSERNSFHFRSFKNQKLCTWWGRLFHSADATISIYCESLPLLQSRWTSSPCTSKAGNLV